MAPGNIATVKLTNAYSRKQAIDDLGIPYRIKQDYVPSVDELTTLERYINFSRDVIGFHPITIQDIIRQEEYGWPPNMCEAAALKFYWMIYLGFSEDECQWIGQNQDDWTLRTKDTIYVKFKTPKVICAIRQASVNLKNGYSLRLWVPPQCISVMKAFKNYDTKFRKHIKENEKYRIQTRMALDFEQISIKYVWRKVVNTPENNIWEDMLPEKTGFMPEYVIPAPDYKLMDIKGSLVRKAYDIPKHHFSPPIIVGELMDDNDLNKDDEVHPSAISNPLELLSSKNKIKEKEKRAALRKIPKNKSKQKILLETLKKVMTEEKKIVASNRKNQKENKLTDPESKF